MKEMDVIEQIMQAMAELDDKTLQATLAYLLKVYVIDRKIPYAGAVNDLPEVTAGHTAPRNFVELITDLKRNYQMEELKLFSIEGGKVYLTLDNKRYQISREEQPQPYFAEPAVNPQSPKNSSGGLKTNRFRNIEMDD